MQIPNEFKKIIADTFYDKDIEIWTEERSAIESSKV